MAELTAINQLLFPLQNQFWKVMVSAISSSSGLKLYVFLFTKGSSLCVCFNILRAWTLWGWVSSRNLGKNNESKEGFNSHDDFDQFVLGDWMLS